MIRTTYDREYDYLNVFFVEDASSYVEESYDGIEVLRDMSTKEITGLIIWDFLTRYKNRTLYSVKFPIELDVDALARTIRDTTKHPELKRM
jgi:hypothetical protein